jgi:hypothetical protein
MENTVVCNFCGGNFGDVYKLERHQRSAKYCLEIQKKETDKTTCSLCKKKCYSERELKAHKCILHKDDLNDVLSSLYNKINLLENRVEDLEKRLKEKIQTEMEIINKEWISKQIDENFRVEHTNKGVFGYASFALEHVFKNRLSLVDRGRKKFLYRNESGETKTDIGLTFLSTLFFSSINERNKKLIISQKKDLPSDDSDEEECIINQWCSYRKYIFLVQNASLGLKDDFVSEFVEIICENL